MKGSNLTPNLVASLLLGAAAVQQAAGQSFEGFSDFIPASISPNGQYLAGTSGTQAAIWSDARGLIVLPMPTGGAHANATRVSSNGVAVGQVTYSGGNQAVRWEGGVASLLPYLQPDGLYANASALTADGTIAAGWSVLPAVDAQAVLWFAGKVEGLGDLPGGVPDSRAHDMTPDGGVIVGQGTTSALSSGGGRPKSSQRAVRWDAGVISALPYPPGANFAEALAVSDDGTVVVGRAASEGQQYQACRWAGGTAQWLGVLPGTDFSEARGVSADGSVAVGRSGGKAFIWEADHGMRDLKVVLESEYGFDLTGWSLSFATDVSPDGRMIVGWGPGPDGFQGWKVELPPLDTDGDGLLDDWEINGIPYADSEGKEHRYVLDIDGDGQSDADPMHKDLFIEVDAMTGFAPSPAALNKVSGAFFFVPAALVDNPDRADGINLYVQLDETSLAPFGWTLDDTNGDGEPDWPTEFDQVKLTAASGTGIPGHFGTVAERNSPNAQAIREAKAKAYRYCIFADEQNPGDRTSGLAEYPGNDFMVTLGGWLSAPGTLDEQAGTFMHELGHTLGLGHGGADGINRKPNYYSVMSYTWQTPKPWMAPGSWPLSPNRLGYSTFALPTLSESALLECGAMVAPGSALAGVEFPYNSTEDPDDPPAPRQGRFDMAVDWNGDGDFKSCLEPVSADVNRLLPKDEAVVETLHGHSDWPALIYNFRDLPTFAPGVHTSALGAPPRELTYEEDVALAEILPPHCAGDIDDDGSVGFADLLAILNAWGPCPGCLEDLDGDGVAGFTDLLEILNGWGPCR